MQHQDRDSYEQACDRAVAWIARLRSDAASEEDRQSFALWLADSASHRAAMDSMLEMWDDLAAAQPLTQQPEAANGPGWWGAAAVAACLALAVLLLPLWSSDPASYQYQTAMGERLTIELPDQSRMVLNTDSRVNVSYSDEQRHIKLARGEAWFQVQKDPQRPFHVDSGSARVTAIGTAFNVQRRGDVTDITVSEGVVRVTELGETGSRVPDTEVLRVSQQLRAAPEGLQPATSADLQQQLAWQRGELVAREMPLPELIAELQRYHQTRILLADRELAVLTVSGVFQLDQPGAILQALELSLGLEVDTLDEHTVRLLKAEQ